MDRSGEGMTYLGMVLGAIGTIVMIVAVVLLFIAIAAASAG